MNINLYPVVDQDAMVLRITMRTGKCYNFMLPSSRTVRGDAKEYEYDFGLSSIIELHSLLNDFLQSHGRL